MDPHSGQHCNIVCTEPRRISAISLAKRVSDEMGEKSIGSFESLCGYQIRFESKRGPSTKLTYCTTGVILRQLQLDPALKDVSHIIIDEVRFTINVELLIYVHVLVQVESHLSFLIYLRVIFNGFATQTTNVNLVDCNQIMLFETELEFQVVFL